MSLKDTAKWLTHFEKYKRFVEENKCFPQITTIYEGDRIGVWFYNQVAALRYNTMVEERIRMMDDVDPTWKDKRSRDKRINQEKWLEHFETFKEFVNEHGNFPFATAVYKDVRIGSWYYNQLASYRNGVLFEDRLKLLDNFNPAWKNGIPHDRSKEQVRWEAHLEHLKQYVAEFGEFPYSSVIYNGDRLGAWFRNQCIAYKEGKLSEARLQKLDEFDPEWKNNTKRKARYDQERWLERFEVLKCYVEEYGKFPRANVVYKGDNIGAWFYIQLETYRLRGGKLPADRHLILDEFNPAWKNRN